MRSAAPLTPEERARLSLLRKLARKRDLTHAEDHELWGLGERRNVEVLLQIPVPQCCEAMRRHRVINFSVDGYGSEGELPSDQAPGRWRLRVETHNPLAHAVRQRENFDNYDELPDPTCCPFCGKGLPPMQRKKQVPKGLCVVTDGGYYCDTCRERLDACECDPPASAFEEVGGHG